MKWFKHYSDSLDDPFIVELMDSFGHLGYVVFFGLIETIAKENGSKLTGKVTISPTYLRRKFRSSQAKVREVLEFCQTSGRLLADFSKKDWELEFPKMLEIKDNYTKDLQGPCKKVSLEKEKEKEKEKEEETDRPKKLEHGEFQNVLLTADETDRLVEKLTQNRTTELIEELSQYVASKGTRYKSHYATILAWARRKQGTDRSKSILDDLE